jgi:hypothetical protein
MSLVSHNLHPKCQASLSVGLGRSVRIRRVYKLSLDPALFLLSPNVHSSHFPAIINPSPNPLRGFHTGQLGP